MPLLVVYSIFLLLRGHNEPGGGFIGGLVAAAGIAIYGLAFSFEQARKALWVEPRTVMAAGWLLAALSALPALALGQPLMKAYWIEVAGYKLGTPLAFDIGVYLIVVGVVLTVFFTLSED